jgi:hypothetical protein
MREPQQPTTIIEEDSRRLGPEKWQNCIHSNEGSFDPRDHFDPVAAAVAGLARNKAAVSRKMSRGPHRRPSERITKLAISHEKRIADE